MINIEKQIHLVQTEKWTQFKEQTGNKVIKIGEVYIMLKKIPLLKSYMGYAPKVNFESQKMEFTELKVACQKENISFVRFDVPNILLQSKIGKKWGPILSENCIKAPRDTFTKNNIYLDLKPGIDSILKNMHAKKRYNIRYAQRSGVEVKVGSTTENFENFWKLHKQTSDRQGFLTHPKSYYEKVHSKFKDSVYYIEARVESHLTTSWMILFSDKTMYYIYGGSSGEFNNKYPNDLVGFKAIELGISKNIELFDMWGAEDGKGFTEFKLRYGGELLEYVNSYDFVIEQFPYKFFNIVYETFWSVANLVKKLK